MPDPFGPITANDERAGTPIERSLRATVLTEVNTQVRRGNGGRHPYKLRETKAKTIPVLVCGQHLERSTVYETIVISHSGVCNEVLATGCACADRRVFPSRRIVWWQRRRRGDHRGEPSRRRHGAPRATSGGPLSRSPRISWVMSWNKWSATTSTSVTIMPVGADPHDFQASAQQIAQLGERCRADRKRSRLRSRLDRCDRVGRGRRNAGLRGN